MKVKRFNVSSATLYEDTVAGFEPFPFICECTDGQFIWNEDLIEYVPYTPESQREYEWKHSKYVIDDILDLNMTSQDLLALCWESGQRPIRHQVCKCTDGKFIWNEKLYKYIPYTTT